jgi:hypothetical protein
MYANDRGAYVYDAQHHLKEMKKKDRICMTKTEYDNFSTPGRDKRLTKFFKAVGDHIADNYQKDKHSHAQRWAAAIFSEKEPQTRDIKELNAFCQVELTLNSIKEDIFKKPLTMSLRMLRKKSESGALVSDPNAPLNYRWGITTEPKYKAKCPTY